MNTTKLADFGSFAWRVTVTHTLTYFLFGLVFSNVFDYAHLFQMEIIRDYMRPVEAIGATGLAFQPLRGLLLALALWPIRPLTLDRRHGWFIVWSILVLIGIVSTSSAAPASLEGIIYSKLPLWYHLIGLPEMLGQTFTFAYGVVWWDRRAVLRRDNPERKPETSVIGEILKVVSIACFAYIGYAAGALLFVAFSKARIDVGAAAGNMKTQLMFVVAFAVNVIAVWAASRRWVSGRITLWQVFALFWLLDAVVPWLYRLLLFGSSALRIAIVLGFLPALIIAGALRATFPRAAHDAGEAAEVHE